MDSSRRVWTHRNFRFLFAARLTDMAGNAVAPIALAFAVLDLNDSTTDVGLVVGARSLALAVLVLFGGVLADRLPRSIVLVWSNLLSAVSQVVVAWLVLSGHATIGYLVVLSLVNGAAAAVSFPASGALITETVPKEILQRANATVRSGTTTINLLGLVVGAALVALVGPGWGLAIDAGSFLLTGILFSRLQLPESPVKSDSLVRDLREGWQVFSSRTWIWVTVLLFLFVNAVYSGALVVLGPAVADDGIGRARWGWVLAAQALGILGATVFLARSTRSWRLRLGVVSGALGAPWIFVLGAAPTLGPLLVLAFVAGLGFGFFEVTWETNLQSEISGEHLARVYSFDMMGSIIAIPIGQVAAGPLADALGRRAALTGAGIFIALACTAAALHPSVRQLQASDQALS